MRSRCDPGGDAGIQAGLKTFLQFGIYGTSVATLVTVQDKVLCWVARLEGLNAVEPKQPA